MEEQKKQIDSTFRGQHDPSVLKQCPADGFRRMRKGERLQTRCAIPGLHPRRATKQCPIPGVWKILCGCVSRHGFLSTIKKHMDDSPFGTPLSPPPPKKNKKVYINHLFELFPNKRGHQLFFLEAGHIVGFWGGGPGQEMHVLFLSLCVKYTLESDAVKLWSMSVDFLGKA